MSVEHLKEYVRRCATEPELREKAKALGMADLEQHMAYAESLGLEWSADDMLAFRKEAIEADGGLEDLSEEDLVEVAGGGVSTTAVVVLGVAAGAAAGVVAGGAVGGGVGAGVAAAVSGGW